VHSRHSLWFQSWQRACVHRWQRLRSQRLIHMWAATAHMWGPGRGRTQLPGSPGCGITKAAWGRRTRGWARKKERKTFMFMYTYIYHIIHHVYVYQACVKGALARKAPPREGGREGGGTCTCRVRHALGLGLRHVEAVARAAGGGLQECSGLTARQYGRAAVRPCGSTAVSFVPPRRRRRRAPPRPPPTARLRTPSPAWRPVAGRGSP
jgi:hypothetical protein